MVHKKAPIKSMMTERVECYDILGVPISMVTPDTAAAQVEAWAADDKGRFVCVRDVASLMIISEDPAISDLHYEASMITPDGMPLALIGKWRGLPVERTCGPDLMDLLIARSEASGLKHYFYGGKPGVALKLCHHFSQKYPNAKIVGFESPPFTQPSPEEDAEIVTRLRASGADVIWIGISSPKQDVWMRDHYRYLPQTLIGVGAAFDFHSNEVRRAPIWMQKSMLEWSYRFAREPRRLWKRYLLLAPRFAVRLMLTSLRQRLSGSSRRIKA